MEEKNVKPASGIKKKHSNNVDKPRAYTSKIENKSPWKITHMGERFSIKFKLTLSHALILMIPVIVIVLLFYNYSKDAILQEVVKANVALANQVTNLVNLKLNEIDATSIILIKDQDVLKVVGKNPDDYESTYLKYMDREENLYSRIMSLKSADSNLRTVAFIKETEVIDPDQTPYLATPNFLEDFQSSDEFAEIMDNKSKSLWYYNLYGSKQLNFTRYVRNFYDNVNKTVLMISVDDDYLRMELDALQFVEGARMSILDKDGKVVVSSDLDLQMGEALPIAGKLKEEVSKSLILNKDSQPIANGNFITGNGENPETMIVFKETVAGWYFVAEIPTVSIYGGINKMAILAIAIVFICLLIALIIGRVLAITITKPIDYIRSLMKLVEKGDFTVRSKHKGKHDLGQLSYSFNTMTENTANLIKEMSTLSSEVALDAEELQKIAGQSALASKEVIEAVELLSEGAMEQAQDADNTAKVIKELVNQINKTEESFNEVVKVTNRTKRASAEATQIIEELSAATTQSASLSNSIKLDMGMLANRFKEILGIIGMINAISAQTNLLALNAAIEAARAGDAGKGFAVVADEIRKLASQSKDAAKCISDIVNSIYKATNNTVEKIESGAYIYQQQEEAVKNTEDTFMEIISDMDNIIHEVDNVYVLIAGLEEIQGTALESITSIAIIAEQSASAIEEVLATTEEQTSSAQYLSDMSTKLYDVIDTMTVNVKKYIVGKNQ